MKKKLFMILALVMATMTASAKAGYDLVGKCENGKVTFKVNGEATTVAQEGDIVTVEVTPDDHWTNGSVTGRWYAAMAGAKAVAATEEIDMLKDFEPAPVLGKENTYTFTMMRANAEITAVLRKSLTHPDIIVYAVAWVPYIAEPVNPIEIVRDGDTYLKEGVDFIVTCTNSVEIGPSVATVTGIGKYSGEVKRTFNIIVNKINLGNAITMARNYYGSIVDDYLEIATKLGMSINVAELVEADEDATQPVVDLTTDELKKAVDDAIVAVRDAKTTGIELAPTLSEGDGVWYDLQGRRIAKPTTKGMYILNGKKIAF